MRCLRCGVKMEGEGKSFCPECSGEMEKEPVKPGTAVQIPNRPVRKRQSTVSQTEKLEGQVAVLQKQVSRLRRIAAVLVVLLTVSIGGLVLVLLHQDTGFDIGQNYHGTGETTGDPTDWSPANRYLR